MNTIKKWLSAAVLSGGTLTQPVLTWAQAADDTSLEEVVVTAEYREVSLQKTALTITALTGDALIQGGIGSSRDLLGNIAGLNMTIGNPNNYISLYGVGSGSGNMWADAMMTFNYGGIPLARQTSANSAFYDLERVEVLKGPQGTLYGKNSTVGAINVVIARPKHVFESEVNISTGNYGAISTQGMVNLPLTDTLAARVAFQTQRHDGYLTNGYDDANNYGSRASLLWTPSSDVSVLLWADNYRNRARGGGSVWRYYFGNGQEWMVPNNPWFSIGPAGSCADQRYCPSFASTAVGGFNAQAQPSAAAGGLGVFGFADLSPGGLGTYSVSGADGRSNADQNIFAGELDWKSRVGAITILASRVDTKIDFLTYSNGLRFMNNTDAYQDILEARLASTGDTRLKWTLGAFYFHEHQDAFQDQMEAAGWALLKTPDLIDKSYAAFGDAALSLTDAFRLTAGLRYTKEDKTQDGYTTADGLSPAQLTTFRTAGATCFNGSIANKVTFGGYLFPSNMCIFQNGGDYKNDNTSWKVGTEWDVRPESMLYLTAKTGFRSGGFTSGTQNTYKPEILTAYELGSRNRFIDDRLQANLSLFYWKYKDQQLSQLQQYFVNGIAVGQTSFPFNVPGDLKGGELDVRARITESDKVWLNVLHVRGKLDQTPLLVASTGVQQALTDVDRYNLPEWTLSGRVDHSFKVRAASSIDLGVGAHYESHTVMRLNDPASIVVGDQRPSFTKWDADVTYNAAGGRWSLQAFVKNIGDIATFGPGSSGQVSTGVFYKAASNPAQFRSAALDPPRTYGLRLNIQFSSN